MARLPVLAVVLEVERPARQGCLGPTGRRTSSCSAHDASGLPVRTVLCLAVGLPFVHARTASVIREAGSDALRADRAADLGVDVTAPAMFPGETTPAKFGQREESGRNWRRPGITNVAKKPWKPTPL
jgi:hypothetical protein